MLLFLFAYTKLVLFNIKLLTAPSPTANSPPPARHMITFKKVALSGAIMDNMVNSNMPAANDPSMESHSFCFATVPKTNAIDINIAVTNILENMQAIMPPTPKPAVLKDKPAIAPPIIAPIKYKTNIIVAPTNVTSDLEKT